MFISVNSDKRIAFAAVEGYNTRYLAVFFRIGKKKENDNGCDG